jgi:hypothetical protein
VEGDETDCVAVEVRDEVEREVLVEEDVDDSRRRTNVEVDVDGSGEKTLRMSV